MAGYTVSVKGLREVVRSFEQYAGAVDDLKEANAAIGSKVSKTASAIAPKRTGDLSRSIRANRAKQKVQIKAGGASVPYAGPIEYGWEARNIQAKPFLRRAAWTERNYVKEQYSANIQAIGRKYVGGR
jgi:hypothetical protein